MTEDAIVVEEDKRLAETYLLFALDAEEYAVNVANVTEIVGIQKIMEVPDVPPFIKGVINLRGKIIPIMDVRLRFGFPERPYDDRTCIIVLDWEENTTGLAVDKVVEVVEIPPSDIAPPSHWESAKGKSVVMGMGKRGEQVSLILNIRELLYEKEVELSAPNTAGTGNETQAA